MCASTFLSQSVTRRRGKDELTSCRGTVLSAWQKPPVRRTGGGTRLPASVSGRHVVRDGSPHLSWKCAQVTGKASENAVVCFYLSHAQGASQPRSFHESTNFNVGDETNHVRTGGPDVGRDASHEPGDEQSMLNDVDFDFRIPGLSHSVVKHCENYRVRELVKKIERRKACLPYWSEGIVYYTCGDLLKESEANRGAIQCTLDLFSIPVCVIKKGRFHGHRYGKVSECKYYLTQYLEKEMHQEKFHRDPRSFLERSCFL